MSVSDIYLQRCALCCWRSITPLFLFPTAGGCVSASTQLGELAHLFWEFEIWFQRSQAVFDGVWTATWNLGSHVRPRKSRDSDTEPTHQGRRRWETCSPGQSGSGSRWVSGSCSHSLVRWGSCFGVPADTCDPCIPPPLSNYFEWAAVTFNRKNLHLGKYSHPSILFLSNFNKITFLRLLVSFCSCVIGESLSPRSESIQLHSSPWPLVTSVISPKSAASCSLSFHLEHKRLRHIPALKNNNTSFFNSCFSQTSPCCHNYTHQKTFAPPLPNF